MQKKLGYLGKYIFKITKFIHWPLIFHGVFLSGDLLILGHSPSKEQSKFVF